MLFLVFFYFLEFFLSILFCQETFFEKNTGPISSEDGNVWWGWVFPMEHACITTNSMGWIAATTIWAMLANMGPFLELPIE